MSSVRVLVGTRKGAFILTADGNARSGTSAVRISPAGRCITSRVRPSIRIGSTHRNRAAGSARRCSDRTTAGKTWHAGRQQVCLRRRAGTHMWYDGTQHPWEFARVWHLEPSLTDPDTVYAGVEDAALFRSTDGGQSWHELSGLRRHESGPSWQPGAGGMCLHTIILDPTDPQRILRGDFGRRRVSLGRRWDDVEAHQSRAALAIHSQSHGRGRTLRPSHRHASFASRACSSCKSIGT